jgi:hypothetical protein
MAGSIARCKWRDKEFYAMPLPGADTINGMTKMRALTKGPRFDRGAEIHVRNDEIIEWVNATPGEA